MKGEGNLSADKLLRIKNSYHQHKTTPIKNKETIVSDLRVMMGYKYLLIGR